MSREVRWCKLSIVFLLAAYFIISPIKVFSATEIISIRVPTDYSKIQDAVNAANVGDTIYVSAGIYRENIIVNKTINLKGENSASTIIEGDEAGTVIKITANNVVIERFTIRALVSQETTGIHLVCSNGSALIGNTIYNCGIGVKIDRSNSCIIRGNNITRNNTGIRVWYSRDNIVNNNIVAYNGNGVDLRTYSQNSNVTENEIKNNEIGIYISHSRNNWIYNNTIEKSSTSGIYLHGSISESNMINHNVIRKNKYGIYIWISKNNMIFNNNFIDNNVSAYLYNGALSPQNFWNSAYPYGGNYWSDYTGKDKYRGRFQNVTGSDGIGDEPYVIDANNKDYYPYMQPIILFHDKQSLYDPVLVVAGVAAVVIMAIALALSSRRRVKNFKRNVRSLKRYEQNDAY